MSGELYDFLHPGTEAHFDLAPVENATAVEQETLVSVKVDPETRKCGISSILLQNGKEALKQN